MFWRKNNFEEPSSSKASRDFKEAVNLNTLNKKLDQVLRSLRLIRSGQVAQSEQLYSINNKVCFYEDNQHAEDEIADLPTMLPFESEDELTILEDDEKRKAVEKYLSSLGGSSPEDLVKRILRRCLSDSFAQSFSWKGTSTKKAFEQHSLKTTIINSVRKTNLGRDMPEKLIEGIVKEFLKYAKAREDRKKPKTQNFSMECNG